jgi:transposase
MENRLKIFNYDDDKFREIVAKSKTYSEIFTNICGKEDRGAVLSYKTELDRKINKLDLDVSQIKNFKFNLDFEKIVNSNTRPKTTLKYYLYHKKLKEEICEKCGQGPEWQGLPLVLQLDHINGNCRDNRLENLRILCGHCHEQTTTFCTGQLKKDKEYVIPSKDVLIKDIKESKTIKNLIKKYNICYYTIFNWVHKYDLTHLYLKFHNPKKEYNCSKCNKKLTEKNKTGLCVWCKSKCPSKEQLLEDIKQLKSRLAIGKKYGVSDNGVKKWYRRYSLLN